MAVLSDPISDFLTRLKNASLAGNEEFTSTFLPRTFPAFSVGLALPSSPPPVV